jgi:hypothetical protein
VSAPAGCGPRGLGGGVVPLQGLNQASEVFFVRLQGMQGAFESLVLTIR